MFYFEKAAEVEKLEASLKGERMMVRAMAEEILVLKDALNTSRSWKAIGDAGTENVSNSAITPSNPSDPNDPFSVLDKDYDSKGYLTRSDIQEFLEVYFPPGNRDQIWRLADVDDDGRLTRDEFDIVWHFIPEGDHDMSVELDLPDTLPADLIPPSMSKNRHIVPSYQLNVNRRKSRKWVEAKPGNYDGDDWNYDEYHPS